MQTSQLKEILLRQLPSDSAAPVVFVGIGSELRGDDAVGVVIVNRLAVEITAASGKYPPRFYFINGGSAPENVLGEIKACRPAAVVFIDAVIIEGESGEPGTVRLIDTAVEKISGISFCTHSLPLTIIANYIRQTIDCAIFVLGIEPGDMNFRPDCILTPAVATAAAEVVEAIIACLDSPYADPEISGLVDA